MTLGNRGPGPPWGVILTFLFLLVMLPALVTSEKSKHYSMQALCKNHFLQQLYRKIDGAVLYSKNERNLDCIITFQTHSILQRFMLRFDFLQMDCNDHLYIYDGAHAVGSYKFDLSCRNTQQKLGPMYTRTNYVTLKYVTDGWGLDSNGFKLVITAVKDPKHACTEFRCTMMEFCIATDLVCDGINHCADGSDETSSNLCHTDPIDCSNNEAKMFPNPTNCRNYHQCVNESLAEFTCPFTLEFNAQLGFCVLPENANCTSLPNNGSAIDSLTATTQKLYENSTSKDFKVSEKNSTEVSGSISQSSHQNNFDSLAEITNANKSSLSNNSTSTITGLTCHNSTQENEFALTVNGVLKFSNNVPQNKLETGTFINEISREQSHPDLKVMNSKNATETIDNNSHLSDSQKKDEREIK